uniref:Putative secreted protein n=1 Tax=Ixodes ricinus TaxID=34613 RepID=A0A6B0TQS9_IXORI
MEGRSGSLMSLICWGKFMFLTADTALAGAADRPASCFSILLWSSMRVMISVMLVSSTMPPMTSSLRM